MSWKEVFLVAVMLLLVAIILFTMTAFAAKKKEEKGVRICTWQKCGFWEGRIINCEEKESGPFSELAKVFAVIDGGAVVYDCRTMQNGD